MRPLQTVASMLEGAGAGGLLDEPALLTATAEINAQVRTRRPYSCSAP